MAQEPSREEKDLILTEGEYAYILDGAKGNVRAYVGPTVQSPSTNDKPVVYDEESRRFPSVRLDQCIKVWPAAIQGQYVVLVAPAKDGVHPSQGSSSSIPELCKGKKVNIPGPYTFPLWPGQTAHVIDGHILKSNEYLLVRVYDEEEAKKNWGKAVIKTPDGKEDKGKKDTGVAGKYRELGVGQLSVVKGTDVSFFIPPTGVEVVPTTDGSFVRSAVTLEQLEYCVLLGEDGTKKFRRGPDVIFPSPTQQFMTDEKSSRKFKAKELEPHWGLHVKVIAEYTEGKQTYKEGEELFITGEEQKIYFPRPEHSIIRYRSGIGGHQDVHFAIAIPKGEARYVLDRTTGDVRTEKGPKMFLPDPRKEVIVRRTLDPTLVKLLYPGNREALEVNEQLQVSDKEQLTGAKQAVRRLMGRGKQRFAASVRSASADFMAAEAIRSVMPVDDGEEREAISDQLLADDFERATEYTPPRTIQLHTKYEGAITICVWTGYAVKIISKTGEHRVVVGPETALLEYDETVEIFGLSTGKPKSDKDCVKDVYLRVKANKVSDIVHAETKDFVSVKIPISYRVSFEGEHDKWFDVENYVKFLTDHLRSFITNTVKSYGIEEFSADYIDILRNKILGESATASERRGRIFEENGMRIYDVELGQLEIGDEDIADLLQANQHEAVRHTLELATEKRHLEVTREKERIGQEIEEAKAVTRQKLTELELGAIADRLQVDMEKETSKATVATAGLEAEVASQKRLDDISSAQLERRKSEDAQKLSVLEKEHQVKADSYVKRLAAIQPKLVEALIAAGQNELAMALAQNLPKSAGGLGLLLGKGGISELRSLFKGTPIARALENLMEESETESEPKL
jgi:major vault protein